jgi:hypothetical protein
MSLASACRVALAVILALPLAAPRGHSQAPTPVIGTSLRYYNPMSIEASSRDGSPQGVGLGDVTVVREGGKYSLFATGGGGGAHLTVGPLSIGELTCADAGSGS